MHIIKDTILKITFVLCFSLLWGCAASSPETSASTSEKAASYQMLQDEKQLLLENTFSEMLSKIQRGVAPDSLLPYITDESRFWLDDLEEAAKTESKEMLSERPFHELLAIITFHLFQREHLFKTNDYRMLYLVTSKKGLLEMVTSLPLGPFEVKNDRGSLGLEKSPKVPVLLFIWDDVSWRMDLKSSIPLITKGLESIGVKKNWSNVTLALYLLEKEFRYDYRDIDESLLDPVPYI